MKNISICLVLLAGLSVMVPQAAHASPLPTGTTLTLAPGGCSGTTVVGSGFGMFGNLPSNLCVVPIGSLLSPGTQGGL